MKTNNSQATLQLHQDFYLSLTLKCNPRQTEQVYARLTHHSFTNHGIMEIKPRLKEIQLQKFLLDNL